MATWDGGGNIPPIRMLARALAARGDDVHILGHESTRELFEDTGSTFVGWANSSQPPVVREFIPPDQEVAYAQEHVFYGKTYQSDLRPVIEELNPDVVMVDVQLRYAILEVLRVDKALIALCHILYGAVASFDDSGSSRFQELNQAAIRDGVPAFTSRRGMVESADCVLVFSYAGFDSLSGEEAGEKVVHVGPLRAESTGPSGWVRRLPDRRLVLIALSTTDQNQGPTLQRLSDARPTRINRHRDRAAYVVACRRLRFQGTHRRTHVAIRLWFSVSTPGDREDLLACFGLRGPEGVAPALGHRATALSAMLGARMSASRASLSPAVSPLGDWLQRERSLAMLTVS